MKTLFYFLFATCCFTGTLISSADWKQERDTASRLRTEAEQNPRTAPYRLGSQTVPASPELCINIHNLDDRVAAGLKQAGFKTARQTVYWYLYEKTTRPGVYDEAALKQLDKRMALYRKHNLTPLVIVHGNAPGANFSNREESYRRFGEFMAMLAKRYPEVRYFQLWNEMDVAFTDLFGARTPKLPMAERGKCYAEMLKIAVPMIREANPAALIVTGGMTDWNEFPRGIYENGGKEYFDILAVHTYGMPMPWAFIRRGVELRRLMDRYGDQDKPLWNTEFGVSAEAMIRAWGIPKEKPLEYFDNGQASQLSSCIDFNRKAKIFSKYFIYAWHAGSEAPKDLREKLSAQLPGINFDDISFSLAKRDGTPRKFLRELIEAQKKSSDAPQGSQLDWRNRQLTMNGAPFFPIGLVFGRSDKDMQRAKSVGMNSIHQEYSLRDVLPDGPDTVSEAGVQRIRDLHETARRNGMVLFPQLTGHYIPGWLAETAGPAPVDPNGKKIGLWFRHSLHDPVYQKALETFWRTVAREVGDDPDCALFVSWNEPAYGLDATPAALAAWRAAMKREYGNIGKFNAAMGTNFRSFAELAPPKTPDENRTFFYHWFRYNQQAFADFFARQRSILKEEAPGIRVTGKHPVTALLGDALYCNDIALQAATQDVYGCDSYNGSLLHYRDAMEAARSLSGGGPVISYETHAQKGLPPLKGEHAALQLFTQILGGCRGIFFYCNGDVPGFGFFNDKATPPEVREKLTAFFRLVNTHQKEFSLPRAQADIAVLLSNAASLHYGSDADPAKRDEYTRRVSQTYDLIRNQHFAVDFISESQLPEKLGNYKLLVIPSRSILTDAELKLLETFVKKGGKLLAFGKAFDRDESFRPRPVPAVLGLKQREPAPWNRGQMRLTEVVPALYPYFPTELIVQEPERVNPVPMEQSIPGYIPETKLEKHLQLAANQDAYASIVMSDDGQVVYCAFDSLYSTELSRLLGGILETGLGINRELRITRPGSTDEAVELLAAVNRQGTEAVLLFANSGPLAGRWEINAPAEFDGEWEDIATGREITIRQGRTLLELPRWGYALFRRKASGHPASR